MLAWRIKQIWAEDVPTREELPQCVKKRRLSGGKVAAHCGTKQDRQDVVLSCKSGLHVTAAVPFVQHAGAERQGNVVNISTKNDGREKKLTKEHPGENNLSSVPFRRTCSSTEKSGPESCSTVKTWPKVFGVELVPFAFA